MNFVATTLRRAMPMRVASAAAVLGMALGGVVLRPAGAATQAREEDGQDREVWWTLDGRERGYLVRVPPGATDDPLPVVVALHGGGGNASQFKRGSGLDEVADREGFLAVYPFGTGRRRDRMLTWNAGDCCGVAQSEDVDDVAFIVAVVDHVAERWPVDRRRVYATGHSNGGMMAYRLAAEAGDRFAAVGPVSGAMIVDPPDRAGRPVPILHIHSVDDPRALYEGGLGPPFPFTTSRVEHRPVLDGLAYWADRNGCPADPVEGETLYGEDGTLNAGQTATRLEYSPCDSGAVVTHIRLTGAGHGWPGEVQGRLRERIIGPSTTLIQAAEEVWAFFAAYALPERR